MESGRITNTFKDKFPSYNTRYTLINATDHSVDFLTQDQTINGVNLVVCHMPDNDAPSYTPYTRTRSMSLISSYFDIEGDNGLYKGLVFSDTTYEKRIIYYASNNETVIDNTTGAKNINVFYILGLTLAFTGLALFAGLLYSLVIIPIPAIAVAIASKLMQPKPSKLYKANLIGAGVHLALKLFITNRIINSGNYTYLQGKWIGSPPMIYVTLIIMSIIAYLIALRYMRQVDDYENNIVSSHALYSLVEIIQYTLLVVIYMITTLLIDQI